MEPIEVILIVIMVLIAHAWGMDRGYQYRRKQAFFEGHRALGFDEWEIEEAWRKRK